MRALDALQETVRSDPANPDHRIFLFQLLCVLGQWERALTQLNTVGEMDDAALAMVQTYREVLQCEVLRAQVFEGKRQPLVFGEPEQWIALAIDALRVAGEGHHEKAQALRAQAFEMAPASEGKIDGEAFAWMADADSRIGPFLEAIVNGRYYWVPIHRISQIQFEEPADLRDLVWTPAQFMWSNGGEGVGFIPTRYAGTEQQNDVLLQLARKTIWQEQAPDVYAGLGQRVLATDADEYDLLATRSIVFASDAAQDN